MTKSELDDLERLIQKNGAPLSPMLIFTLIDELRNAEARLAAVIALHCVDRQYPNLCRCGEHLNECRDRAAATGDTT